MVTRYMITRCGNEATAPVVKATGNQQNAGEVPNNWRDLEMSNQILPFVLVNKQWWEWTQNNIPSTDTWKQDNYVNLVSSFFDWFKRSRKIEYTCKFRCANKGSPKYWKKSYQLRSSKPNSVWYHFRSPPNNPSFIIVGAERKKDVNSCSF